MTTKQEAAASASEAKNLAGEAKAGRPVEPEKVTPIDVPANEPYPTGSPPDAEDAFFAAHGFRRAKE